MFEKLTVQGQRGSVLWGHRSVAILRRWTIAKTDAGEWYLSAAVEKADAFQTRQRPLIFAAPRQGGFWCWPVLTLHLHPSRLTAKLGPPEQ